MIVHVTDVSASASFHIPQAMNGRQPIAMAPCLCRVNPSPITRETISPMFLPNSCNRVYSYNFNKALRAFINQKPCKEQSPPGFETRLGLSFLSSAGVDLFLPWFMEK